MTTPAVGYMKVVLPPGAKISPWHFFPFSDRLSQDRAYVQAHNLAGRRSGRVVTYGEVAGVYDHLPKVGDGIGMADECECETNETSETTEEGVAAE